MNHLYQILPNYHFLFLINKNQLTFGGAFLIFSNIIISEATSISCAGPNRARVCPGHDYTTSHPLSRAGHCRHHYHMSIVYASSWLLGIWIYNLITH